MSGGVDGAAVTRPSLPRRVIAENTPQWPYSTPGIVIA